MALTISSARATLGLSCTATPIASGVSGSLQIGSGNQNIRMDNTLSAYSLFAVFAGASDVLELNFGNGSTSGSTTWANGSPQVETATAAGTITTAGNATCIVTSAGMAGSPLTVTFAVALSDTAAQWAEKCRVALAANATIAARFTVSGSSTSVILTRLPTHTFTVPGGTLPIYAATDSTLNIALADATSAGITEAASSANTTAGTASDGLKIYGGDLDVEGATINLSYVAGLHFISHGSNSVTVEGDSFDRMVIGAMESVVRAAVNEIGCDGAYTFTASGTSALAITVLGS
jgi:hypothetical protein